MSVTTLLPTAREPEFDRGVAFAEEFFMNSSKVHHSLKALVQRLDELHIPYGIIDAMTLNKYGYRRITQDVDVLLTAEGLAAFKQAYLGRGYVEKFLGSRDLRDTPYDTGIV